MIVAGFSLLAFALTASEQNNYTRPELTAVNRIEITDGKSVDHSLQTVHMECFLSLLDILCYRLLSSFQITIRVTHNHRERISIF